MTLTLRRPFDGTPVITQVFGNQNSMEPSGYTYPDGSVGYVWKAGAVAGHPHNGVDYALACGTPLLASADGTVAFAGWDTTGFGNRVSVDHGGGVQTLLGHMSEIDVAVGQKVMAGQRLGLSGTSGNSTGCHLHWSVQQNGVYVSPAPFLATPTPPAPPPAPAPPASTAHPPATADEAAHVLLRHAQALVDHPDVAGTNSLVAAIAKWPTNFSK